MLLLGCQHMDLDDLLDRIISQTLESRTLASRKRVSFMMFHACQHLAVHRTRSTDFSEHHGLKHVGQPSGLVTRRVAVQRFVV